jgi:hypothetical protein
MTLSDLASIGTLVSGVAVLISLIYLAMQVRQNTASLQRAEANETQNQASVFRSSIVDNRDVAELWATGLKADGLLDEVDELRFQTLVTEQLWWSYHLWDREQRGIMPKGSWNTMSPWLMATLTSGRGAKFWASHKSVTPHDYVQVVDETIDAHQAAIQRQ